MRIRIRLRFWWNKWIASTQLKLPDVLINKLKKKKKYEKDLS